MPFGVTACPKKISPNVQWSISGDHKINGWDAGSSKRWDRWHSPSPNWQVFLPLIYHLNTAAVGWLYATYHLLEEPETTIDKMNLFRNL